MFYDIQVPPIQGFHRISMTFNIISEKVKESYQLKKANVLCGHSWITDWFKYSLSVKALV